MYYNIQIYSALNSASLLYSTLIRNIHACAIVSFRYY